MTSPQPSRQVLSSSDRELLLTVFTYRSPNSTRTKCCLEGRRPREAEAMIGRAPFYLSHLYHVSSARLRSTTMAQSGFMS